MSKNIFDILDEPMPRAAKQSPSERTQPCASGGGVHAGDDLEPDLAWRPWHGQVAANERPRNQRRVTTPNEDTVIGHLDVLTAAGLVFIVLWLGHILLIAADHALHHIFSH